MEPRSPSPWARALTLACLGVSVFGASFVLAPAWTLQGFSLMLYGRAGRLAELGPDAVRYLGLAHAVLGAVMVGWGLLLASVAHRFVARGSRWGWRVITLSLVTWAVPDTAYSLASGHVPNAILNLVFLVVLGVPLAKLRATCPQD